MKCNRSVCLRNGSVLSPAGRQRDVGRVGDGRRSEPLLAPGQPALPPGGVLWRWLVVTWSVLVVGLAGCATHNADHLNASPRSLGRDLPVCEAVPASGATHAEQWPQFSEPTKTLDLREALVLALRYNPELASFAWDIRAAEARELQARLLPNPEAGVDLENVGGDLDGLQESETTIAVAQSILLGSKRSRAMRVAAAERQLAGWAYEAKRLDVFSEAVQSFVTLLGAQEKVRIAQETFRIAQEVLTAADKRVAAGDASSVESTRAAVAHAQASTQVNRARQELEAARVRLSATWGSATPVFQEATGTLECQVAPPPLSALRLRLAESPELMSAAVEVVRRDAALAVERAKRVPDVSVLAGYRWIEGDRVSTMVFGLGVPVPLFDRNQGGIREARANLARAEWQRRDAELRVQAALADAYSELTTALEERRTFAERVLPGATDAFRKTQQGYQQGGFDYLELLTAQETLAQTRASYLEALVRVNLAVARVERLVGEPILTAGMPQLNRKEEK